MTLANWAGDRCSRLRTSRPLTPYSGSPDRPRPAVLLPHDPAAHVPGHLHRELHHVKEVHDKTVRLRQHPAHRRGVDGAHVDRHDLRRRPARPAAAWASQYAASSAVRPSTCPSSALIPGQVEEAGMPPVGEQQVLAGLLIDRRSGAGHGGARRCPGAPPAPGAPLAPRSACSANAAWATGQDTCCHRPASATVQPRSATSAPSRSRSRLVSRHRGGICGQPTR